VNRYGVPADVVVRLIAALLLGVVVGLEREASEQAAGLRTHVAVCLGAALFGVISTTGFDEFRNLRNNTNFGVDPTRVASNVAVGIGFLGAGLIFREGSTVRNLTTAASLWAVAAIGLAAGVGDVGTAGLATLLTITYLVALKPVRTLVQRRARAGAEDLAVTFTPEVGVAEIHRILEEAPGVDPGDLTLEKRDGALIMRLSMRERRRGHRHDIERFVATLVDRPEVRSLERR
jgi:putative Mg2+ transporter-C (MgtC) family protein